MTQLNVLIRQKSAHIQQDAATFLSKTGEIVRLAPKVAELPTLRACLAGCGCVFPESMKAPPGATFETFLVELPDKGRHWFSLESPKIFPELSPSDRHFYLIAAGWSGFRRKFEAWGLASGGPNHPFGTEYEPFTLCLLPNPMLSLAPVIDLAAVLGRQLTGFDLEELDALKVAGRLADAQRALRISGEILPPGWSPGHFVGGWSDLVSIDVRGITRTRVRTWPSDRVGERIAA